MISISALAPPLCYIFDKKGRLALAIQMGAVASAQLLHLSEHATSGSWPVAQKLANRELLRANLTA